MPLSEQEYLSYDMIGLAKLVQTKQVSERELRDLVLSRLEKQNPDINAVVALYEPSPVDQPDVGAFAGVPFFIKDLYAHVQGEVTTGACTALRGNIVDHDSEIVRRYRQAGLRILGRSNTCEFGTLGTCEPVMHGPTRNPWAFERTCGGSSGGAGALVSARILRCCAWGRWMPAPLEFPRPAAGCSD